MKYEQAQIAIVDMIAQGALLEDGRLPNEEELANYCGVSGITIRRALSELGSIGIIERIQGKGTFVKQSPINGQTLGTVAMMAIGPNPFSYDAMLGSAQRALQKRGYMARFLAATSPCNSIATELKGVSGVLISGRIDDTWIRLLRAMAIPFVVLGNMESDEPVWRVDFAWENGTRLLTKMVHQQGCDRIGMISGGRHYQSGVRAYQGYVQAVEELNLPFEAGWTAWCPRGDYVARLETFFEAHPDTFDALIVEQGIFPTVLAQLYRAPAAKRPLLGLLSGQSIYEGDAEGILHLQFDREISDRGVELLFKAMSAPHAEAQVEFLEPSRTAAGPTA